MILDDDRTTHVDVHLRVDIEDLTEEVVLVGENWEIHSASAVLVCNNEKGASREERSFEPHS